MATMFTETDTPVDEPPDTVNNLGDYDPLYPGSTPDAPYGYFENGNPRKRRPKGMGGTRISGVSRSSNTAQAVAAAQMLARINGLVGISLNMFGMPMTAAMLADANKNFEAMATEALMSDPALCKKILSAGQSSGKAGLTMAYIVMGVSIAPGITAEYKMKRRAAETVEGEAYETEPES